MNDTSNRANPLLVAVVALLALAVIGQGALLYKLNRAVRKDGANGSTANFASTPALTANPSHQKPVAAKPRRTPPPQPAAPPDTVAQAFDDPLDDPTFNRIDPFEEVAHMRQQMESLLGNVAQFFQGAPTLDDAWAAFPMRPDLDIRDDQGAYVVRMDMPGTDKSKIDLNIADRTLMISGTTDETSEQKTGGRVLRSERRSGNFQRSITLPGPVDAGRMTAKYENGTLIVTVPKAPCGLARHNVPIS